MKTRKKFMELLVTQGVLDKFHLTAEEFFTLLVMDFQISQDVLDSLEKKEWLRNGRYIGEERMSEILMKMQAKEKAESEISELAAELQACFPTGKKEGTVYYWRGSKVEIETKLRKFFVYYGDTYTREQIIDATKRYVESFGGNYRYMRLLKYFIWKNDIKPGSDTVEKVSELASYIDNYTEEEQIDNYYDRIV